MRIVTVLGRLAVIALLPSETLTKLTDRDSTFTPWPTKFVKLLPKNFFREIVSIWFGSDKIQVGGQFSLQILFIAAHPKKISLSSADEQSGGWTCPFPKPDEGSVEDWVFGKQRS